MFRATFHAILAASIYLLKVAAEAVEQNIRYVSLNSNSTTSASRSSVFLVNFQKIPHLMLGFLMLTLNM